MPSGYLSLGVEQLALAAGLILVNGAISLGLRLGMERRLAVASLRSVVQLALVGLVLEWVFDLGRPIPILGLCLLMIVAAAVTAARRPERRYRGIYRDSFVSMLASSAVITLAAVVGIVSLPGMMTGQILAGAPPADAVRYQILILFMIAASTALGTLGAVLLGYRRLFDDRDRLRVERVRGG